MISLQSTKLGAGRIPPNPESLVSGSGRLSQEVWAITRRAPQTILCGGVLRLRLKQIVPQDFRN